MLNGRKLAAHFVYALVRLTMLLAISFVSPGIKLCIFATWLERKANKLYGEP